MPISLADAERAPARVFITGAAGFMGRALMARYAAAGVTVARMDLRPDPGAGIVAGDTTEPQGWAPAVAGTDVFVHCAASLAMDGDPDEVWRINVLGTRRALDAAIGAGVRRFVHVSSVVAFGFDFPDGVDEAWPVRPNGSPYVDTKVASEQVVLQAHAAGEIEVVVVRPGDIFGPGSMPWTVLPAQAAAAGLRIVPLDREGIINPTYIDNLLDGLVLAAAEPTAAGQVITVADGEAMSVHDFFGHYHALAGHDPAALVDAPLEPFTEGFLTKTSGRYSIDKARRLLGYEPRVPFDEGMAATVAWLRTQGIV